MDTAKSARQSETSSRQGVESCERVIGIGRSGVETVDVAEAGRGGVNTAGTGTSDFDEEEEEEDVESSESTGSGAVDGPGVGSEVAAAGCARLARCFPDNCDFVLLASISSAVSVASTKCPSSIFF